MPSEPPSTPPVGPLARLRSQLAGPRGVRRIDALLESDDPAAAVAALSVSEIHELITEVGFGDASDLMLLATPDQIRGCLDLDVWDRDQPNMELARPWIAALLETGFEKVGEVWNALDAEWRALFIKRHTELFDISEEGALADLDDSDGQPFYMTPDRTFAVKLLGDEDTTRLVMALLEDLYRADLNLARHTLMAADTEPAAHLEELSYRWRSGRLADLGYVDFYDALDLFQPLEPDAVRIGEGSQDRFATAIDEEPAVLPMSVAERVVTRSYLARAWGRIVDPVEEERLEGALVLLVNKVLAAARARPGDHDTVRAGADYATATVSLGLEVLSRGDLDRAAEALRSVSMTRLHRVGYTVSLKLARLARGLAPRASTAAEPDVSVVTALVGARPWFARVLDEPSKPGVRPFESQADVRRVAELLARLTLRIAVAESLGVHLLGMNEVPEPRPALDDHARTAIVRVLAGGPPEPHAVSEADLRAAARVLERGALPPSARARAQSALLGRLDAARLEAGGVHLLALIDGWLAEVEALLAGLGPDPVDPRFVEGVLVGTLKA